MPMDRNSANGTELRPLASPLSRPLPPELQGGEENFDRASEAVATTNLPQGFLGEVRA